ncbi:putative acylamino-acid-releasing enzyme [Mycobacterium xenopi 4042]|uniref:Putative acylamino-acid-releasing enzyme n=1 Tax=Mycobacterium xenopi 4042 TaxID=1299334 RepID=X8AMR4_MYCXE|nr:putative acylamino-acid-releasing enzyme [Mycobacterium xenopi 3993]EUA33197.1 putative acylamino-acid-releasing enzyme [Mycobacterium xenopi 4042]
MSATAFDDLDDYLALPRVSALAVAADGSRVVTTVAELNDNRSEYVSAVWELDPAGRTPARRLTRSANGESSPAFTADGDLLFVSARAKAEKADDEKPPASLWRLPADGGEAVEVLAMPGGVSVVQSARSAEVTVVGAPLLPAAQTVVDDRRLRDLRKDSKVTAILYTKYPVRHWDKDLGPDEVHLFDASGPRDLTPRPGAALREDGFDISADGRFLVTTWRVSGPGPCSARCCCGLTSNPGTASSSSMTRMRIWSARPSPRTARPWRSRGKQSPTLVARREGRCIACGLARNRQSSPQIGTAGRRR